MKYSYKLYSRWENEEGERGLTFNAHLRGYDQYQALSDSVKGSDDYFKHTVDRVLKEIENQRGIGNYYQWDDHVELKSFRIEFCGMDYSEAYMNLYETYQAFGGPEEGGWWYPIGHVISSIRVESKKEEENARELLNEYLDNNYPDHNERRTFYPSNQGAG